MDRPIGRDLALDSIEEADEFEMAVALHAAADHGAGEHAERGEQGGGAVPLIIMRHGLKRPGLIGSPGWVRSSAWIWLLSSIDSTTAWASGSTPGVRPMAGPRASAKPDNVGELGGKAGIAPALERAQPVRLKFVRPPDALHRTHRDADGLGHCPAGPVGRLVRRSARQGHHPSRGFRRQRRLAGLAGLVAQQTLNPALGEALLPPPHRRPADANAFRHLLRRVPICRGEHDARPLHMLRGRLRPIAVGHDRRQLLALRSAQNHGYLLCHGPSPQAMTPVSHIPCLCESSE